MKNKFKLTLTILNTETGKTDEIFFPLCTPERRRRFDALKIRDGNYLILKSDFPISKAACTMIALDASLNDINYFCNLWRFELDNSAKELFEILAECDKINLESTRDLLTGLFALNDYYSIANASTAEQVGRFYCLLAKSVGAELGNYKATAENCAKIGKFIMSLDDGWFFEGNYYGKSKTFRSELAKKREIEIPKGFIVV